MEQIPPFLIKGLGRNLEYITPVRNIRYGGKLSLAERWPGRVSLTQAELQPATTREFYAWCIF